MYADVRTGDPGAIIINRCLVSFSFAHYSVASDDALSMSAYQGLRIFSHVVLGLMSAGIVYAAYIAITYWTGISV